MNFREPHVDLLGNFLCVSFEVSPHKALSKTEIIVNKKIPISCRHVREREGGRRNIKNVLKLKICNWKDFKLF